MEAWMGAQRGHEVGPRISGQARAAPHRVARIVVEEREPGCGIGRIGEVDRSDVQGHSPSSPHIASTFFFTSASMTIGRPHSRLVSPGHLLVASMPILEPRPATGLAKSR